MDKDTESFVVRLWHEACADGENAHWRGSIDHIGTHRRLYFNELNGIIRFIQDQIGIKATSRTPWLHALLKRISHEFEGFRTSGRQ